MASTSPAALNDDFAGWSLRLRSPSKRDRLDAIRAVTDALSVPPSAVPAVLERLRDPDRLVRLVASCALVRLGSSERLLKALVDAPEHNPAVRELHARLVTSETILNAANAAVAATAVNDSAVSILLEFIEGTDEELRWSAVTMLGSMGKEVAAAAAGAVAKSLVDPQCRDSAAWALVQMGPAVVPVLVEQLLQQKVSSIRAAAAKAVAGLRSHGAPAVPALVLQLSDRAVGLAAMNALSAVGPDAIPTLLLASRSDNPVVRVAAIGSLVTIAFQRESSRIARNVEDCIRQARHDRDEIVQAVAMAAYAAFNAESSRASVASTIEPDISCGSCSSSGCGQGIIGGLQVQCGCSCHQEHYLVASELTSKEAAFAAIRDEHLRKVHQLVSRAWSE